MRLERFCNNPACDDCDVLLTLRDALKTGGQEMCPRCLEPLVVRAARPRIPLRKTPPVTARLHERAE